MAQGGESIFEQRERIQDSGWHYIKQIKFNYIKMDILISSCNIHFFYYVQKQENQNGAGLEEIYEIFHKQNWKLIWCVDVI